MAEESEVAFNFDIKPFMDGLKKVNQGFTKTFSEVSKIGKSIATAIMTPFQKLKEVVKIGKGIATAIMAPFQKIKKEALNAMPIVGQAVDFAKDVFTRNLFAPLQRELLPILQQLMKWVTDNRTTFIKWGQVIANVFRGVWESAKIVFNVVKSIIDMITKSLLNHFGGAFATIEELVNTIVWKVTMVMLFLAASLEKILPSFQPLIDGIIGFVGTAVSKFLEIGSSMLQAWNDGGNFEKLITAVQLALEGIGAIIDAVVTGITNLVIQLLRPNEFGDSFGDVAVSLGELVKAAGELIKSGIKGFFEGFGKAIDPISTTIKNIVDKFTELVNMLNSGGKIEIAFKFFGQATGNILMAVLAGIETGMNNLTTRFKQLSVLMNSDLSFDQKWKQLKELETAKNTANSAAWDRVAIVKSVGDTFNRGLESINRGLESLSFLNTEERERESNPVAKATYTNNEAGAWAWYQKNIPETYFYTVYAYDTFGKTYKDMFKEIMGPATNDFTNGSYKDFITSFKKNAEYKGLYSQVKDAIITKTGKVIQTAPDDNIYAFKNLGSIAPPSITQQIVPPPPVFQPAPMITPPPVIQQSTGIPPQRPEPVTAVNNTRSAQSVPAPVAVQFGDVLITVPEGSTPEDAQQIGMAAAEGFASRLAQELSMSLLREGA
jgi:hypothetical protein